MFEEVKEIEFEPKVNPLEPKVNPLEPKVNPNPDPNTNPHPNLVLAASNAKIVMLEQSLEQTKQSNQSIINELESSKENLVVDLAAKNAKNVLLEARLASTTVE